MMQYLPWLKASGIEVQIAPFFGDAYLERLYAGRSKGHLIAPYFARRVRELLGKVEVDAIWLEKELLPWVPWMIEGWLLPRGVPLISDYDDAVFHGYDLHRNLLVRTLLGRKIDGVMSRSAIVIAGNSYLAARASKSKTARIEIVPTVVDAESYSIVSDGNSNRPLRIGWIGTPSTWRQYMKPMMPMLSNLARESGVKLRAVGAGTHATAELESLQWKEAEEGRMIQGMDIGLMPLDDTPWSQGKCGYKIIQYMACGLPVIASPVGVNSDIIEDGVTGFLASTEAEWREAIGRLLHDADLRRQMGAAGRKRMEERYSLQVWGPKVAKMLHSVVSA